VTAAAGTGVAVAAVTVHPGFWIIPTDIWNPRTTENTPSKSGGSNKPAFASQCRQIRVNLKQDALILGVSKGELR
jgi:hypothetical protein